MRHYIILLNSQNRITNLDYMSTFHSDRGCHTFSSSPYIIIISIER
uniref:Uncharacterized protein n=1 Tax=Siphoviridae sp. ct8HH20 TaxID=2825359 RepID=A0A8S5Q6N3_9CAUD|nr:MAG TPA: hypothetical protein [Siphoviridae sp. ct8HH20]